MADILDSIAERIRAREAAAHAYIVELRSSTRRAERMHSFAKQVMCESPLASIKPCGHCKACLQIDAGTHLDVIHMSRSGKSGYLANDANNLVSRLGMGAYSSHLIGIIDDGDLLSEILQNKLLKTIEEPADGVIILIGTSNADNLLSTVRSRCSHVRLVDEAESASLELADYLDKPFYQYRNAIDKNLSSQDDAFALLGMLEDANRDAMLQGGQDAQGYASAIELIEQTRQDIYRGMNYDRALKRLYLELY